MLLMGLFPICVWYSLDRRYNQKNRTKPYRCFLFSSSSSFYWVFFLIKSYDLFAMEAQGTLLNPLLLFVLNLWFWVIDCDITQNTPSWFIIIIFLDAIDLPLFCKHLIWYLVKAESLCSIYYLFHGDMCQCIVVFLSLKDRMDCCFWMK